MTNDSDPPSNEGIPAWQLAKASPKDEPSTTHQSPDDSNDSHEELKPREQGSNSEPTQTAKQDDEQLIANARRFLSDDRVKNEPADKKAAFLESRGLSREVLDKVMISSSGSNETTSQITPTTDTPPIITYPEFLLHASKPPPLVTATTLINTAYAASGFFAAIYGVSRYLIGPMTESLQASRHDFAENALHKIEELNLKLGAAVSVDPGTSRNSKPANEALPNNTDADLDASSEAESVDSDPTELFHRDIGTQTLPSHSKTTPSSSPASSTASATYATSSNLSTHPVDPTTAQITQLANLQDLTTRLTAGSTSETSTSTEVIALISTLTTQLESLAYPITSVGQTSSYSYDAYGFPRDREGRRLGEEDEVARCKAEIRGVKGVLLSARNFPSGAGGGSGGRRGAFPPVPTSASTGVGVWDGA